MLTAETPGASAAASTAARAASRSTRSRPSGNSGAVKPPKMGRQPGLDGIRTFSVGMVALHHAEIVQIQIFGEGSHHEVITGGFVYPEMFFVMSGFLITTIMLQEREGTGRFSLKGFYARRVRRLLPALWVMMGTAVVWATFFGYITAPGRTVGARYHLGSMEGSTIASFFMVQNWWMIFSRNGYFGGFPDLFRHIWTLSIDEQFYIVFPLVLLALFGRGRHFDLRKLLWAIVPFIALGWFVMAWKFEAPLGDDNFAVNFVYLSTITRMPGILIGVALACLWRPWRWPHASRGHLPWLDVVGLGSFALILVIGFTAHSEAWYVYRGLLPIVSLLAACVVAMVVHPGALYTRAFFGNKVIAGIGQRAFGIYLWHWPIFAGPLATKSFGTKMLVGIPLTALFAEMSYRFIETPFRERAVGKWRDKVRAASAFDRRALVRPVAIISAGCLFLVAAMAVRLATAEKFDLTSDGGIEDVVDGESALETTFETTPGATDTLAPGDSAALTESSEPAVVDTAAPQTGRVRLAIVGSSQAVMLGKNLPTSAKETFRVSKGGKSGCTVFPKGTIKSVEGFAWTFDKNCKGWLTAWTKATSEVDAEIVLVVTGGWDVFDIKVNAETLAFGSDEFDQYWLDSLQVGIDAMKEKGAKVALLEVPCLRPVDDAGAGVPPLPERRDDDRTKHISDLMRRAAKADPQNVYFIENADEWCTDPSINENKQYRFDGVHVLSKGAKLIMDTITPALLAIPLDGR